jgi:hypothetical protein
MWSRLYEPPLGLPPKHAAVFRYAAGVLFGLTEDLGDDDSDSDGDVFERLPQGQKLAAILVVAKALLDTTGEPPEITAALAATVSAIYDHLEAAINIEMDTGETTVRKMILEALDEMCSTQPLAPDSDDMDDWSRLVEILRREVLEDDDFRMDFMFLDAPPDKAAAAKAEMHIDPDYFVTPVEDPSPQRLCEIRRELRSLLSQC